MDIETFIRDKELEPGDRIGIYCVSPRLLPKPFNEMYRCGAAGTKEVITTGGSMSSSNFRSRLAMYHSNWIQGGILHFCLTVPRSVFLGYTMKVMDDENIDPRDAREPIAQPGSTMLQYEERRYHKAIEALGIKRVRERAEWFQTKDLSLIESAMRSIGAGTFYKFKNNKIVVKQRLTGKRVRTVRAKHRRSPRDLRKTNALIIKPAKDSSPELRRTLLNPRVAATIAELAQDNDAPVQTIRLTRSKRKAVDLDANKPVSQRTRLGKARNLIYNV